jgi:hypothetical protein
MNNNHYNIVQIYDFFRLLSRELIYLFLPLQRLSQNLL